MTSHASPALAQLELDENLTLSASAVLPPNNVKCFAEISTNPH
jgi:hypothetical protein